jgi:hypothetical protein
LGDIGRADTSFGHVVWRVRVVVEHDRHGQPLAASAQLHAANLIQSHGGRLAADPPDLGAVSGSPVKKYAVSGRGRRISIASLFRPRGRRSSIDRCRSPFAGDRLRAVA